ncbi:two-component system, sensor histidine kinase YesM [Paenibacillus sp. UNCCL117]|uniref:cache domain-containing sensor histidine kinase n=1 Tax=unclassified Paenibacillus TaxID=185978 RepID=UPI0008921737|nr:MULTISPECIES: sensor histidine kinase [unclassified Paenibacillus]SDD68974.1 two-component system, sensor histidine kinase YesM [Paenibacillus sp. cl123]SFW45043.1 two-component system, sensor histidine kinase YesM [Paenibacillus sp. UNCCL117]
MKAPLKTFSFQTTFLASFLALAGLLILIPGLSSYVITTEEVAAQTIEARRLLLSEVNKQLELQFEAVEYDSLALSSNPKLINFLQEKDGSYEQVEQGGEIVAMLSRVSYVKEGLHSVQLFAPELSIPLQGGSNGIYPYSRLENSPWFHTIRQADYGWVGAHTAEIGGFVSGDREVVSFARKVLSSTGKEIGLLVFNLKMSFMDKMLSSGELSSSRILLGGSYERVAAYFNRGGQASYETLRPSLENKLRASEAAGYAVVGRGDDKELLIWSRQSRTQWLTLDIIPWADIAKGSERIKQVMLIAGISAAVLASAMAYILARQLGAPIRQLVRAMNMLKTGRLDVRIPNEYSNEFGHLNDNFNQMTERIDQLLAEVNEQNRRKRSAEIRVLQEQINPHFLYNTLDMINWRAIELGASDISRMLSLLGKMFRIGLASGAAFVPLRRELEHLRAYLELQRIRYKQKYEFAVELPEEVMACYIPKLILQPFVENSLRHGLHECESGYIRITGGLEGDTLWLRIEDNGRGMEHPERMLEPPEGDGSEAGGRRSEHSGIRNVQERIRLYFGEMYGVELESRPGYGMTVRLRLPVRLEAEAWNQRKEERADD